MPGYRGLQLAFSPKSEWFGVDHRDARMAIPFLLDFKVLRALGTPNTIGKYWQTAMPTQADKKYLTENLKKGMVDYGLKSRTKKATQHLEAAGWSKKNGRWYNADGKKFTQEFKYPAGWAAVLKQARTIAEQLTAFGLKTEAVGVENATFFGEVTPSHDFDMAATGTWKAGMTGYPYLSFKETLGSLTDIGVHYTNELETVKVPMPVGDPDGDLQKVNLNKKIKALSSAAKERKAKQLIREIAWVDNQWMPYIQPFESPTNYHIATNNWNYPPKDDPQLQSHWQWAYLPRIGEITARLQ